MRQERKVILLAGPTASGKSKLAIKLAEHYNAEIINADSMQIYKEISILNSKPSVQDIKIAKHHLYGFNLAKKNFSTGHWLKLTLKKINEIWASKKTPIVVGGTGLYFKALTDGLVEIPNIPNKLRTQIRKLHKEIGQEKFFIQLIKLDPLVKKFILPLDSQRSLRAYEVKKFTNKSLFEFVKDTFISSDSIPSILSNVSKSKISTVNTTDSVVLISFILYRPGGPSASFLNLSKNSPNKPLQSDGTKSV